MKFEKPALAALLVAFVSGIASLIGFGWFAVYNHVPFQFWQLLLAAIVLGLVTYYATYFTVNQFI
jgi:hypothetical protein